MFLLNRKGVAMSSPIFRILLILLLLNSAGAGEIRCKHFFFGMPQGMHESNVLVIRDCYALSANGKTKFADWVAYRLTQQEVSGELDLERQWRADPWLPEEWTLEPLPDDYRGAFEAHGYQRGHLAPLASFRGSVGASQVNYYSNIVPQKGPMNRGPWAAIENWEREQVRHGTALWVMTGPLYERTMPKLPRADEEHVVPSGFWKVVGTNPKVQVVGFIVDQEAAASLGMVECVVSVDEIERRSGLELMKDWAEQGEGEKVVNKKWVSP